MSKRHILNQNMKLEQIQLQRDPETGLICLLGTNCVVLLLSAQLFV